MSEDYYDILGIGKDADPESIRKAYRREAKKSHPDSSGCPASSERFRKVEEAYETLGDRDRREAYDERESTQRSSPIPVRTSPVEPEPFFPGGAYRQEAAEPLLEILLDPEEAGRGVAIPVEIPVSAPCPDCTGGGFWRRMFCFTCGATGTVRSVKRMVLEVPPGIRSGREFLIDTGAHPARKIRLRVLVG